jgi:hypothetical protein
LLQGARRQNNFANSNSSINSQPVNAQPVKPSFKDFQNEAKEIGSVSAPLKLNPKAKIKGKIALIEKSDYGTYEMKGFSYDGSDYYQFDLDKYDLAKDKLAVKREEIDTLILRSCDKGKQIGQYSVSDGSKIPAFALDCKVSIIDYRIPAVVAEKKFSSRELAKDIKITSATKEWTAYEPSEEMEKYIKNFPRE